MGDEAEATGSKAEQGSSVDAAGAKTNPKLIAGMVGGLLVALLICAQLGLLGEMPWQLTPPTDAEVRQAVQASFPEHDRLTLSGVNPRERVREGDFYRVQLGMTVTLDRSRRLDRIFELPWIDEGPTDPLPDKGVFKKGCSRHGVAREALLERDDSKLWVLRRYERGKGSVECGESNFRSR